MTQSFAPIKKTLVLLTVCALFAVVPIYSAIAQGVTVKAQPSSTAPKYGITFTVDITISNVKNLYAVDVQLSWNKDVLRITSASPQLGVEAHPGGVLHQNVYVALDSMSQQTGTYQLVATSEGSAAPFTGNGKIATLTFTVIHTGYSQLTLETELADKPVPPDSANLINHTDQSSSVNAVIPEFSTVFAIIAFLILATGVLVFSKKHMKKNMNIPTRYV